MPRAFQLESGLTFAGLIDGDRRHRQVDFPEATVRFGLTPRVELFANVSSFFWDRASARGASDLSVHAKLGLLSEKTNGLTLSAAAGLSLPVGSDAFSSGGYDPSLRLLWSRGLPNDFGLSGNLNVASVSAGDNRVIASAASVGVSHPLAGSTSWFAELFGAFVEGDATWQMDGGVAIIAAPDIQFDLSAGRTLQSGPSAWFVAGGITLRHRR